jgi:hypothetical protein
MTLCHFPPRSPAITAWEHIALIRDEQRKRAACPHRQRMTHLMRAEIAEWQRLKDAAEPCDWHIGSSASPFFAEINAARAAAEG